MINSMFMPTPEKDASNGGAKTGKSSNAKVADVSHYEALNDKTLKIKIKEYMKDCLYN